MSLLSDFRMQVLGERGILLQWDREPKEAFLMELLHLKMELQQSFKCEVIHTYCEILIKKNPTSLDLNRIAEIVSLLKDRDSPIQNSYKIPVCYEPVFGTDIKAFAADKECTIQEVIRLHTEATYTIYFMGFLPGFLYLEGLSPALYMPRKATPSLNVTQGSVAIGGQQTGIYPQNSPGGWHIIGKTPLVLFNVAKTIPSPFKAGDRLQFYAVNHDTYQSIAHKVEEGSYIIEQF